MTVTYDPSYSGRYPGSFGMSSSVYSDLSDGAGPRFKFDLQAVTIRAFGQSSPSVLSRSYPLWVGSPSFASGSNGNDSTFSGDRIFYPLASLVSSIDSTC